ncbi:MAG: HAMP domain-containing histidine kinase [Nitrospinae bacterium]|nr:HAMP domain-containing histidine kinase [Nitrospinota bacterium]
MNDGTEKKPPNQQFAALFLRLAARELQTPASHLKSKFLALAEESDPWKAREEIRELSENMHLLSRLIETLSDAADIETQHVTLEHAEINLAHLFSERIGKRLWSFPSFRFLPELPPRLDIYGDRTRLTFLIDDLLDASIHIAPEGGIIHAFLMRENDRIFLSTTNRDAEIPPFCFDSFIDWMAKDLENPGALQGIGIGLYRSHLTALILGGRLDITSPPEGGASFRVEFPVHHTQQSDLP